MNKEKQLDNSESPNERAVDDRDRLKSFLHFDNYDEYLEDKIPLDPEGDCSDEVVLDDNFTVRNVILIVNLVVINFCFPSCNRANI